MSDDSTPAILGGRPAFDRMVPILRPSLPDLEELAASLRAVLASGRVTNGPRVCELEEAAAAYLGVRYCVAVSSATSGLLLVLRSLGLRGEVVLPSFGFFATAHAVAWNGLRPVLVDCEADTFNVDPGAVEAATGSATAAIVAVHMYGNPASVGELERIAGRRGVPLIFDAAHALGACHQGVRVGSFGTAEVFSLSPTKTVIAGEGGLVATQDGALARRLRAARNYGDAGDYDPEVLGLNARMSEFHAVLALWSLARVEQDVARRNAIAARYEARLGRLPGVGFQRVRPGNRSTYKDFSFLVDARVLGLERDVLCRALEAEGVMTRRYFFPPIHRQKLYRGESAVSSGSLAMTERISEAVVSLPIYRDLGDGDVDRICAAIEKISAHAEEITLRVRAAR